ncbi:ABC transporter permease [Apibacter sp. HY039]|uniref:ABC transporter permease n=1 Tax=Apibacter sp. HY039 TaxID=2501476 RepID=UPI000FEB8912|nr:ABC transporter permease [Apibacter sp. HY039]
MLNNIKEYFYAIGDSLRTEIRLIFSDAAVYSSYIGATLLIGILYSYVYSKEVISELPIVVVDLDQTQMSNKLVRMINATKEVSVKYSVSDMSQAHELFDSGLVKGVVVVNHNFSKKIQKGEVPALSVYCDASYMLYYKQMLTAVTSSAGTFSAGIEINKLIGSGLTSRQALDSRRPVNPISKPLYNIDAGYATFLMPVVFLIAIQTLQISGMGIIGGTQREKKQYPENYEFMKRPFGVIFILIGRSGAYVLLSTLIMILQMGFVMRIFDFPLRGNPWEAILFLIPFILSVTFLGIFLTNFFKNREDAVMTVTIFSIPALFLCGVSWPTIAFPEWLKVLSIFSPSTLGVKGYVEITQFGASFQEIKNTWFQLWGITFFYFILAVLSLKRLYFLNLNKSVD